MTDNIECWSPKDQKKTKKPPLRLLSIAENPVQSRRIVPEDILNRLKRTRFGEFYILRLKKFSTIRSIAKRVSPFVFKWLLKLYFVANQTKLRKRTKWIKLIKYHEYLATNKIPKKILFKARNTVITAPIIYPKEKSSILDKNKNELKYPIIYSSVINDAVVIGGSNLIRSSNNCICQDLFNPLDDYTSEELHALIKISPKKKRIAFMESKQTSAGLKKAISFTDACSPNYAHWITEILPRIAVYVHKLGDKNTPIVIDNQLHPNIIESLYHIVGSEIPVIPLKHGNTIKIQHLIHISTVGYVPFQPRRSKRISINQGSFSSDAISLTKDQIKAKTSRTKNENWPTKIYIRRNSGIRNIINASEVETYLYSKGFAIVEPEQFSFIQQVNLFNNAKVIVGSSGAALANMIFTKKNANIIILIGEYKYTSYWYWQNMANAAGNKIKYVIGQPAPGPLTNIHSDFSVDLSDLNSALTS